MEPRTRPDSLSAVPGSAAWSPLWVSTCCQAVQAPVATARVRTSTVPSSSAAAFSQTRPSSENGSTARRGRPCGRRPAHGPRGLGE
ncbi:hypothetical protein ACFQ60_21280 [Streptomyces zhihengii]